MSIGDFLLFLHGDAKWPVVNYVQEAKIIFLRLLHEKIPPPY
ncbi:hypothetical protein ADILRU_2698 [Leifsonia rubra CMS 76R]|nr:hypothetical protein ADILRU_2698 [Leifsonia rubra CMS 76R]